MEYVAVFTAIVDRSGRAVCRWHLRQRGGRGRPPGPLLRDRCQPAGSCSSSLDESPAVLPNEDSASLQVYAPTSQTTAIGVAAASVMEKNGLNLLAQHSGSLKECPRFYSLGVAAFDVRVFCLFLLVFPTSHAGNLSPPVTREDSLHFTCTTGELR
jgi:hypothetical protein